MAEATEDATATTDTKGKGKDKPADGTGVDKPAVLTKAELQELLDGRAEEVRHEVEEQHKAARQKEKEAEDEKAAKEKGEWEKVAAQEKSKREAAELASKGKDLDIALRDYLAEKHPTHLAAAKWIRPHVVFDAGTTDETLKKRVAEAADAYVKDNPREAASPRPGGGARPASPGGKLPAGSLPAGVVNNEGRTKLSALTRGF